MGEWEDRKRWFRISLIVIGLNFLLIIGFFILGGLFDGLISKSTFLLIIIILILIIFRKKIFRRR